MVKALGEGNSYILDGKKNSFLRGFLHMQSGIEDVILLDVLDKNDEVRETIEMTVSEALTRLS